MDRAAAEVRRGFHKILQEQTNVISARWKEGYKALKLENDTWQKDLRDSHRDAEVNLKAEQQFQYNHLLKREK